EIKKLYQKHLKHEQEQFTWSITYLEEILPLHIKNFYQKINPIIKEYIPHLQKLVQSFQIHLTQFQIQIQPIPQQNISLDDSIQSYILLLQQLLQLHTNYNQLFKKDPSLFQNISIS